MALLLQDWHGSSFMPLPFPSVHVYKDASGSYGCGAVAAGYRWFNFPWPPSWYNNNIASKELVPIVVASATWGRAWMRLHICFY